MFRSDLMESTTDLARNGLGVKMFLFLGGSPEVTDYNTRMAYSN